MYMSHFSSNELIFNKDGDEIVSAGFGINSILLHKGLSPILSFTTDYDTDTDTDTDTNSNSSSNTSSSDSDEDDSKKKVFRSFKHLAIPLGLFLDETIVNTKNINSIKSINNDEPGYKQVPNDMYEELLKLVYYNDKQKRQTKKNVNNKKDKKKGRTYKRNKI